MVLKTGPDRSVRPVEPGIGQSSDPSIVSKTVLLKIGGESLEPPENR